MKERGGPAASNPKKWLYRCPMGRYSSRGHDVLVLQKSFLSLLWPGLAIDEKLIRRSMTVVKKIMFCGMELLKGTIIKKIYVGSLLNQSSDWSETLFWTA